MANGQDPFDQAWEQTEPDEFDAAWGADEPDGPRGPIQTRWDFGRAALQGLTFGTSDELRGLVEGAGALLPGGRSPAEAYREGRDAERQALKEMPGLLRGVGEITGGVVAAPITGGAIAARIPQYARMGRIGRGAVLGATEGAAYGAGSTEGGPGERFEGALGHGLAGGALGAAAPVAGAAAKLGGRAAKSAAGNVGIGALVGEGLAQTMVPGTVGLGALGGGNMASYLRRAWGRRQGRGLHQKALEAVDKIPGVGAARAAGRGIGRAARAAGRGFDALTGVPQRPTPRAPTPDIPDPSRQLPRVSSAGPNVPPSPDVNAVPMGGIGSTGPDYAGAARRAAMTSRSARTRPPFDMGEVTQFPAGMGGPAAAPAGRQIPARSSAPIVTRPPRPQPDPQAQAWLASGAARRGRIGREVPESLVVPRDPSPGVTRRAQSTQFAQKARTEKVDKLLSVIQENIPEGVTPVQVADFLEQQPREALEEYVQRAGVNKPSDETWGQVFNALRRGGSEVADPLDVARSRFGSDEELTRAMRAGFRDEPLGRQLRASVDLNKRLGRIGRP